MMRVIILLLIFVCNLCSTSFAEDAISDAIDLYKKGDYKNCIVKANETVKADPTSVLGYYYLALSYSKLSNKEQALKNYNKVISLGSDKTLVNLAKSARNKINDKEKAKQITGVGDMLIDTDEIKKKELSGEAIVEEKKTPQKEAKPVAQKQENKQEKQADGQPSNDEIVNAIRVLQRAGLLQGGLGAIPQQQPQQAPQQTQQYQPYQQQGQYPQQNNNMYMDERTREMHAMMQMMNYNNNGYGNNNNMMNMMPFMQNGGKMSPEMVQMMMMQQMMPDFSNNNNGR